MTEPGFPVHGAGRGDLPAPPGPAPIDYPPAARPTFDTPLSAPVSVHVPDGRPHPRPAPPPADISGSSPTGAHQTAGPRPTGRRRARAALWVVSVLLVLALTGGAYVGYLAVQWADRSDAWEAESRALGVEVAELTGDVSGMTAELTTVRDQLATAQTRITELADEKAQVGDDRESQKLIAEDIQEVAETALDVAGGLGDCVTAQNALLTLVSVPETTTPEALQTAIDQADSVCEVAVDDYNSLMDDLADM